MSQHTSPLTRQRLVMVIVSMVLVLLICIFFASTNGAGTIPLRVLFYPADASEAQRIILFDIRIPRVLIAGLIGGALAVAGVVFQALLRNPLADPYVLGISGGASIGGVLALVSGIGAAAGLLDNLTVPIFAFVGALGALFLIERIATVDGRLSVYTVLLTGVIFNAFAGALIYFIQSIASLEQLHDIVFYLMGRIPSLGESKLLGLAIFITISTLALISMSRDYNALSLGEDGAANLGVDVDRLKRRTFILGSLLTGICVAFAGLVGFVGLVVPHILRLIHGPDHRLLLPTAFLGGGSFLILADLFARIVVTPGELPVGVVTALVGGPFFLYLLRKRSRIYGI